MPSRTASNYAVPCSNTVCATAEYKYISCTETTISLRTATRYETWSCCSWRSQKRRLHGKKKERNRKQAAIGTHRHCRRLKSNRRTLKFHHVHALSFTIFARSTMYLPVDQRHQQDVDTVRYVSHWFAKLYILNQLRVCVLKWRWHAKQTFLIFLVGICCFEVLPTKRVLANITEYVSDDMLASHQLASLFLS